MAMEIRKFKCVIRVVKNMIWVRGSLKGNGMKKRKGTNKNSNHTIRKSKAYKGKKTNLEDILARFGEAYKKHHNKAEADTKDR